MESCVNKKDSAFQKAIISTAMKEKINPARRILWVSNAPWAATGYGQQTAQAITRIKANGDDIAVAANYGLEASATIWNSAAGSIPVYPRGMDTWSNDVIPAHMHDWSSRNKDAEHLLMTLFAFGDLLFFNKRMRVI